MNETAIQMPIRPRNAREAEQAGREWRAEVEPYQQQLVRLYSLAMPSFCLYEDGRLERGAPTEGLSPELVEQARWLHALIDESRAQFQRRTGL